MCYMEFFIKPPYIELCVEPYIKPLYIHRALYRALVVLPKGYILGVALRGGIRRSIT